MIEVISTLFCLLCAYVSFCVGCLVLFRRTHPAYYYAAGVLIAIDQVVNAMVFGNEDQTVSGRAGRGRAQGSRFWTLVANFIDRLFCDPTHCDKAIEVDEASLSAKYAWPFLLWYVSIMLLSVMLFGALFYVWWFR